MGGNVRREKRGRERKKGSEEGQEERAMEGGAEIVEETCNMRGISEGKEKREEDGRRLWVKVEEK